jgi:hypothetical protein
MSLPVGLPEDQKPRKREDVSACTPASKVDPELRNTVNSVMISHHSKPQVSFEDLDEDNPRNWRPRKKIGIAIFIIVAGFVA